MMIATSKRVRFTVREYFRMSEAGVFGDRRVELINGRIFQVHAQLSPHRLSITKTNIVLNRHFSDLKKFWPVVQGTLILQPYGAPDPDFHVFDVPAGTPDRKLPRPFIVIEISNRSYKRDSGAKLRQYAKAGIRDYWIVNIPARRVEVYRNPENPTGRAGDWRYGSVEFFEAGDSVAMLAFPHVRLSVDKLLP